MKLNDETRTSGLGREYDDSFLSPTWVADEAIRYRYEDGHVETDDYQLGDIPELPTAARTFVRAQLADGNLTRQDLQNIKRAASRGQI